MADLVLDVCAHLSKRLAIAFGLEDGVVAEALPSPALLDDFTFDDAFELGDLSILY